jgi:hypothetical protein
MPFTLTNLKENLEDLQSGATTTTDLRPSG